MDTTTLLQWSRNNDKKQRVFVFNKVAELLDSTTVGQWNNIDGAKNPTVMGTPGISCPKLLESDWLQGPTWLKDERWSSQIDQKLTNEHQQVDHRIEMATVFNAQTFFEAFASNQTA